MKGDFAVFEEHRSKKEKDSKKPAIEQNSAEPQKEQSKVSDPVINFPSGQDIDEKAAFKADEKE